jgi:hypothetical protein
MKRRLGLTIAPLVAVLVSLQCKSDSTGPQAQGLCAGTGAVVAFCNQVDHYEAGYGVPGQDYINVTCLSGPSGATVSNTMNGTYTCGGTYKLTTFSTATIGLHWGGSTSYSSYHEYQITSAGTGSFTVTVTKISGGSGNLFLSMASGSSWMFDVVPINTGCTASHAAPPNAEPGQRAPLAPAPEVAPGATIVKFVPRVYRPTGEATGQGGG